MSQQEIKIVLGDIIKFCGFDLCLFMSSEGKSLGILRRGAMVELFNKLDERSIEKAKEIIFPSLLYFKKRP